MMSKLVILTACLLSVAAAQCLLFAPEEEWDEELEPRTLIRYEALFAGPALLLAERHHVSGATIARLSQVGVEYYRVRGGLALLDVAEPSFYYLLPVTAGYTIYDNRFSYGGRLFTKGTEVYVEATVGFISGHVYQMQAEIPFRGTLELVCSADAYGLGASVAAGCYYFNRESWTGEGSELGLYVAARLHLLRSRWGFGIRGE